MTQCQNCQKDFTITDQDRGFYNKIGVPEPLDCPDCRRQRRLAWRNERTLYKRPCDSCGQEIVSLYPENNAAPVYCHQCWWSDKWETTNYGQEVDFNRPFFDQFAELVKKVPRLTIINSKCINSEFCNYSYSNKNCYLTIGCHYEEDCLYTDHSTHNHSCLDIERSGNCELCYECIDCANCFQSSWLDFSKDCLDCHFLYNSSGCQHCFLSANLLNQKFIFQNKQLNESEYCKKVSEYLNGNYKKYQEAIELYKKVVQETIHRPTYQVYCSDCLGDNLVNCKKLYFGFNATQCEDCRYGVLMDAQYDSMDIDYMGFDRSEVCYQTIGCAGIFNCYFCDSCWHDHHLQYCNLAFGSRECFGCVGIKNKKYCILNKQYSEEGYKRLKEKIIAKMSGEAGSLPSGKAGGSAGKQNGEYGKFFPFTSSPYGYNTTVALEPINYPLSKEEVKKIGGWWQKDVPGTFGQETIKDLPDNIKEVSDDILKEILACENCGKNYKIISEELKFYQKLNLPLPRLCPDCRYFNRLKRRNPHQLYQRQCAKCGQDINTTYAPERPGTVYCEECYRKEVY